MNSLFVSQIPDLIAEIRIEFILSIANQYYSLPYILKEKGYIQLRVYKETLLVTTFY